MTDPIPSTLHPHAFAEVGDASGMIDVRISNRSIQLFSEGLYSSPNKAVEELVANAFDAGAQNVHITLSPDLVDPAATIVVIDDGNGMDEAALRNHWLIGESQKRKVGYKAPRGRPQIGKFGIGKLATYVLGWRFSHITKVNGQYFGASMDYTQVTSEKVDIPLRSLSETEAREATSWLSKGKGPGYKAIPLFGPKSPLSWTVSIISDLKHMAQEIRRKRLAWVLSSAMPLRDDFQLFLDGERIESSKISGQHVGSWRIGKQIQSLAKPAPDELEPTEDSSVPEKVHNRYGLTHSVLGRITGNVELFEDLLTGGKSSELGRSHGFFVFVRGRLINGDDEYFGIDSNKLRHGTFSRFRCEVHIDRLDEELRSSRETVRDTSLVVTARNILQGLFSFARAQHKAYEARLDPKSRVQHRLESTPESLARRPLRELVHKALRGDIAPSYVKVPRGLSTGELKDFRERIDNLGSADGEKLVKEVLHTSLGQAARLARYDAERNVLEINTEHPFVAYFGNEFSDERSNLPLELMAMSEVLLEAQLFQLCNDEHLVADIVDQRDELLRFLSRSIGKRNPLVISQDLIESATDKNRLEEELVSAFDSMGFQAIPIGGSGEPDGVAEAHIGGDGKGKRRYKVSLEAKSMEKPGGRVQSKTVGVSAIARQREKHDCDHTIVVGPDFATTREDAAVVDEIKANRRSTGKTITLMRITDLAKLVRLVPMKRVGLDRLRDLFDSCTTPEESAAWVEGVAQADPPPQPPYRKILEVIASEQKDAPERYVSFERVEGRLRWEHKLELGIGEVTDLCRALARMSPDYVSVRKTTVELTTRPDIILASIGALISSYPDGEADAGSVWKNL